MNFEIIERKTIREALEEVLHQGLRPASAEEVYHLRNIKQFIPPSQYAVGTLELSNGERRTASLHELQNIDRLYARRDRLLCTNFNGDLFILDDDPNEAVRFIGIPLEVPTSVQSGGEDLNSESILPLLTGLVAGGLPGMLGPKRAYMNVHLPGRWSGNLELQEMPYLRQPKPTKTVLLDNIIESIDTYLKK